MKKLLAIFLLMLCFSCGRQGGNEDEPIPNPIPNRPVPGGDSFGDIQPVLTKFCAECHSDAVFIATEKGLLASKALTRITNRSMPPNFAKNFAQWKDADRARILAFVQSKQLGK
jgi:hypothetical protein